MKATLLTIAVGAVAALVVSSANATTLEDVKAKGFVQCGVNTGLIGFGSTDDKGEWKGFDVDYCRAVAAAVFGDPKAVKFTPLTAKERFTALAVRRNRHAGAQHDLDHVARHLARPHLRRRQLL